MGHTHNENGKTQTEQQIIGNEVVTYKDFYCTCGKLMRREIIHRDKW